MYLLILVILIINLQMSFMQATCSRTLRLANPSVIDSAHSGYAHNSRHLPANQPGDVASHQRANDSSLVVGLNASSTSLTLGENPTERLQLANEPMTELPSPAISSTQATEQLMQSPAQQDGGADLNTLRLEYNKYKILSHLGMVSNPDKLKPKLDNDIRHRLLQSQALDTSQQESARQNNFQYRHKRSLACNQVKSDKDACCLETFYVNFTDIGWDKWILYPGGYNANYCRGQCDLSHARYYHSTLLSKFSNVIGLCCSPKQLAPLRLLYIDEDNKVHQKSMPEMIVESCDCA